MPNHQFESINRSAYMTLIWADKIVPVSGAPIVLDELMFEIEGFPFGCKIKPCSTESKVINIAIVHDYVWSGKYHYPNAPKEKQIGKVSDDKFLNGKLYGFDVIVYGDNHQGFQIERGKTTIFNCGTLMRRKSDEIDYRPQVGLLLESGEVIPHYLDISKDKYLDTADDVEKPDLDITDFIDGLEKLGATALDFLDAMKIFLRRGKISDEAKEIILNAMEK